MKDTSNKQTTGKIKVTVKAPVIDKDKAVAYFEKVLTTLPRHADGDCFGASRWICPFCREDIRDSDATEETAMKKITHNLDCVYLTAQTMVTK